MQKVKTAFFVFLHAALCFLAFTLHYVEPALNLKEDFTPFSFTPSGHLFDEAHFYAPGARRFEKFGVLSHDTDVYERREDPGMYPQGPSLLIGGLAKVIGNFETTWVLLHGILPALFLVLFYFLTKSFFLPWLFLAIGFGPKFGLLLTKSAWVEPPDFIRLPNPALSGFVLLVVSVFFLHFVKKKTNPKHGLWIGLLGGLLFQFYTFYAISWILSVGLILAFAILERDRKLLFLAFVLVGTLLTALPTVVSLLQYQSTLEESVVLRQGFISREISWEGLLLFLSITPLAFLAWKKDRPDLSLGLCLLTTCGIGSNLQIFTGTDIHYWLHYRMRLIQPLVVLFGGVLLTWKFKRCLPYLTVLVMALLFYRQYNVGKNFKNQLIAQRETTQMLHWIRDNVEDPTVFSTTEMELIATLPANSGQWSFVPSSYRTQASDEEILKRYVLASILENKTLDQTLTSLKSPAIDPAYPWTLPIYLLIRKPGVTPGMELLVRSYWNELETNGISDERKLDLLIVKSDAKLPSFDWNRQFINAKWQILAPSADGRTTSR